MIEACKVCARPIDTDDSDEQGVCGDCCWRIAWRYRDRILHEVERRRVESIKKLTEEAERRKAWTAENVATLFAAYEQPKDTSWVYYARIGDHIKIGFTTNVAHRMRVLRVPIDDLLALEPGGREEERARHLEFDHLRITRRWENFRPEPDLLAHIEAVLKQYGLPLWLRPPRRGLNGPITVRKIE